MGIIINLKKLLKICNYLACKSLNMQLDFKQFFYYKTELIIKFRQQITKAIIQNQIISNNLFGQQTTLMERLRIRSMLNHIKHSKNNVSAPKTTDTESQNLVGRMSTIQNEHEKIKEFNKTHNSFTIEPIQIGSKEIQMFKMSNQDQIQKYLPSTARQRKKTKILNKSFMSITPIKLQDIEQNLKQLGIKKKKINIRNIQPHNKNRTLDSKVENYFNKQENQQKQFKKQMVPKMNRILTVQTNRSMSDSNRIKLQQKQSIKTSKNCKSFLLTREQKLPQPLKIPALVSRFLLRKQSDITPWQIQSPMFNTLKP